ncbi:5'/3'-nucleotidase SurE [Mangrovibrevibacter kandeliae]|uniref:5'/3'-nucleotidase SurE n=1 Tax=Mangrovibrevibacter kandeliae TaxID=2968473 RepID=UPI002118C014|nr:MULTISPECIES: 5'/3'-nucleotidase SurE [unclassified Aurantimonas]MCQ8781760.1 5'/3'-nucleotidase SurE [Aurantimonas sp. CSK15Z-1]MCW4114879.1 5'/3'-nucleotidase SurE [Aurantimonas sp. MSK8Z-1]
MRILLTNDDGIHAEGLAVLERVARSLSHDVWVVAPETDQSGLSHSLTLSMPLRLRTIGEQKFALTGTPTDCVIMAAKRLMPAPPDLVLSGVNAGQNICDDVSYSGTVAGAMEGAMLGLRSIALSQAFTPDRDRELLWEAAERHAPAVIEKLLSLDVPPTTLFNVNFPAVPADEVAGIALTRQGKLDYNIGIEERRDGRGLPYYWLKFGRQVGAEVERSDIAALIAGRISVTPLTMDLTDHALRADLETQFD